MNSYDSLPPPHAIDAMMRYCRCCQCCQSPPCDGVMAGGMCDDLKCTREDTEDSEDSGDDE